MQVINVGTIIESKSNSSTDISTGNVSDSSGEKRKRNKLTKAQQFKEERQKIVLELEKLMGLTESNRGILLYDLEHNEKLKEYLKEQVENIKKYYKCGTWNYFIQKEENRDLIGLLKSILKNEKYKLINDKKYIEKNGNKKQYTYLHVINDERLCKLLQ